MAKYVYGKRCKRCKMWQLILTSTAMKARKERKKRKPGKALVDTSICSSAPGSWRRSTMRAAQQVPAVTHTLSFIDVWATLKSHGKFKLHFFPHSFCILSNSLTLCCAKQFYQWALTAGPCFIPAAHGTAFQSSEIPYPVFLPPDSICKACTSTLSSLGPDWQQRHSAVQNTNQQERSNHLFKG